MNSEFCLIRLGLGGGDRSGGSPWAWPDAGLRSSSGDTGDLDSSLWDSGKERGSLERGQSWSFQQASCCSLVVACRYFLVGGQWDADWGVALQGQYYLLGLTIFESLLSSIKEALV